MTGVLTERGNSDTGTDTVNRHREKMAISNPRNFRGCQKLEVRSATAPSLDL